MAFLFLEKELAARALLPAELNTPLFNSDDIHRLIRYY